MGPRAYRTGATTPRALSGLAVLLLGRMGYMSYYLRHQQ
jgi:hypothetical protein